VVGEAETAFARRFVYEQMQGTQLRQRELVGRGALVALAVPLITKKVIKGFYARRR
jgi:hypothetical protein